MTDRRSIYSRLKKNRNGASSIYQSHCYGLMFRVLVFVVLASVSSTGFGQFQDCALSRERLGVLRSYLLVDFCEHALTTSFSLETRAHNSEQLNQHSRLDFYRSCNRESEKCDGRVLPSGAEFPGIPRKKLRYVEEINKYADLYSIDPLLLHSIAYVESNYNASAVSPKGAIGLMQLMPATARRMGHRGASKELYDPLTNIRLSCIYLRFLYDNFGNDLPLVLAAYNAGENAVLKYGRSIPPYMETQTYVRRVVNRYLELRTL